MPVTIIVLLLSIIFVPMPTDMLLRFLLGATMLIIGIGLFTLGADTSMMIMGEKIGTEVTKTRNVWLISFACFLIGVFITIAEPDLRVLAEQTDIAGDWVLIISVAIGVGVFLLIAFLRILLGIKLRLLLIIFYTIVFGLAFSPLIAESFIPVAFDSGGVTTGPITVPFIISLGLGLSAIRGDKNSEEDTFGLVALSSIGPIITVLVLGALSNGGTATVESEALVKYSDTVEVFQGFIQNLPEQLLDVAIAVLPIIVLSAIFQFSLIRMRLSLLKQVGVGYLLTYVGLTLFLTGVDFGFMPIGNYIGAEIGKSEFSWTLIPLGAIIGYFIVAAEPAVHVLKEQVEKVTVGLIKGKALGIALSIGVAVSVGLSMLRIVCNIPLMYFLFPGYVFSIVMAFFVPSIYTSIAFDSGGVASGPMTATFLLPFAIGACGAMGGDVAQNAFGVVSFVALTPLIAIQMLGLIAKIKVGKVPEKELMIIDIDDEIIDLKELERR